MNPATGSARPLAGRRVLVTRPRAQSDELVHQLEAAGAIAIVAPTIRIAPPIDAEPLQAAARAAAQFDWIVFASANAVDAFLDVVGSETRLPRTAAVGSRTAARLRERGITPAVVPGEFRAEALVASLVGESSLAGNRVLLPRSEIGRDVIAEGLRAAGAEVIDVVAYRTVAETDGATADVQEMLQRGALDAVTFTSGSAVRNFVQLYGVGTKGQLERPVVAVIGPVTADVAREMGIQVHVQPATYTTAAMVDALAEYFSSRQSHPTDGRPTALNRPE